VRHWFVICRYECAMPVWSCAWNADDRNYFYAGLQNGTVLVFDVRNLSEPVVTLNQDTGSRSPVVSVQYMPGTSGSSIRYCHSSSIIIIIVQYSNMIRVSENPWTTRTLYNKKDAFGVKRNTENEQSTAE